MSDSAEAADGQLLAYEEAKRLAKLKPDHELLRYVLHPDDDVVWGEFVTVFGKPGLSREEKKAYPAGACMYAQYWIALREAWAELDPENPTPPGLLSAVVANQHGITDDDIPF